MDKLCNICGRALKRYAKSSTNLCRWCYTKRVPTGRRSHTWKGGRGVHKGYIYIRISGIEDINLQKLCRETIEGRAKGKTRSGLVWEHQLKMIERLGRPLKPDEQVHHLDGDRSNNDINNLILVTTRTHDSLHRQVLLENKLLKERISYLESLTKT